MVSRACWGERSEGRFSAWTTPFGNLAIPDWNQGPMALRPTLTDGLPLSWNRGKQTFSAILMSTDEINGTNGNKPSDHATGIGMAGGSLKSMSILWLVKCPC